MCAYIVLGESFALIFNCFSDDMLPFIRASLQLVFVLGCVCHLKTASSAFAATTDYQLLSERPTAENDSPDYVVFIGTTIST